MYAARCHNEPQDAVWQPGAVCCCLLLLPHKKFCAATTDFPLKMNGGSRFAARFGCKVLVATLSCYKMQKSAEVISCGVCVDVKVQESHSVARMFELRGSNLQTKWTKKRGLFDARFLKLVHMETRRCASLRFVFACYHFKPVVAMPVVMYF